MSRLRLATPVQMLALVALLIASLLSITSTQQPASAAQVDEQPVTSALSWLRTQQLDNGGFAGLSGEANPSITADAVIAFASAGIDPATVTSSTGASPVDYLTANAGSVTSKPGQSAKLIMAFHAAGVNPRDVNGINLIEAVQSGYDTNTGFYGQGIFNHAMALLGLSVADAPVEPAAIDLIPATQRDDGSWSFTGEREAGSGDSNTTALVVQALIAVGGNVDAINAGLDYLAGLQDANGAIAYDASRTPITGDANSTALAIQAFAAAGRDPASLPGGNALAALTGFQNPSGAFFWQAATPDDNFLATVQAIPALQLEPLPVDAPSVDKTQPKPSLSEAREPVHAVAADGCTYHLPTFHNVCGDFSSYWQDNGGLKVFGYPLTEPYVEDGMVVQYFERAKVEHHPDLAGTGYEVLLTRLGAGIVESWTAPPPEAERSSEGESCQSFEATGHAVCGPFLSYWQENGGLSIFGYPLTTEVTENGTTVQYFERARLEWRSGSSPEMHDILQGRLGVEVIERVASQ